MMVRKLIPWVSFIIAIMMLTACGSPVSPEAFFGEEESSGIPDPPEEFADLSNPFDGDPEMIAKGDVLYKTNCSSCHGLSGEGDGPAGAGLEPEPENLARNQSDLSDSYLFWRIYDGGLIEPFNSLMPAWKGLMSDEKIWQVVSYLRTL